MRSLTAALAAALVLLPATPALAADQAPVAVDDAVTYRNIGGIDYAGQRDWRTTATRRRPADLHGRRRRPPRATAYIRPDGSTTAHLGDTGTDSFTYTVSDGGEHRTGTVTVTLWGRPPRTRGRRHHRPAPGSATLTWTAPRAPPSTGSTGTDCSSPRPGPDLHRRLGSTTRQLPVRARGAVNGGGFGGAAVDHRLPAGATADVHRPRGGRHRRPDDAVGGLVRRRASPVPGTCTGTAHSGGTSQ